jgi:predicted nucleotidyltransferase
MKREEILKYLAEHKPEFERKFGVRKIGLFGSYAREESNSDSDIDIVVELDKPDLLTLVGIKQTIEEHLNLNVDIVRYRDRMNQVLKKRIDRDAHYA